MLLICIIGDGIQGGRRLMFIPVWSKNISFRYNPFRKSDVSYGKKKCSSEPNLVMSLDIKSGLLFPYSPL
jgi:hypothetical protein